jgi:hypothetical protein
MSDAREVQQLLVRLKDAAHSNNKRHIAVDASDKEMARDLRKSPPSGYTPLFPPAEVLEKAQNVKRRICCSLFVICYFISSLTRATRCKNLSSKCTGLQFNRTRVAESYSKSIGPDARILRRSNGLPDHGISDGARTST